MHNNTVIIAKPLRFLALSMSLTLAACTGADTSTHKQTDVNGAPANTHSVALNFEITNVPYVAPTLQDEIFSSSIDHAAIEKVAEAVANWQLAQFDIRSNKMRPEGRPSGTPHGWMYATLHIGLWHWAQAIDSDLYRQTVMNLSQLNDYQLGPRIYHADDHAVGDVYLSIYNSFGGASRIANTIAHFDAVVDSPSQVDLAFINDNKTTHTFDLRTYIDPQCTDRWCWADAVFMSPPVMAHLSQTTGDPKYLAFMDKEFWAMTDYLFDKEVQLYLRDSRYFDRKDDQGRLIFWGRGNGWVLAGIARTIHYMPDDFANRQKYIDLFSTMSKALLSLQLDDGSWPSSLLERNKDTHSETSATALLAYALAWGVNNNILNDEKYTTSIEKAWKSIVENIHPNGKVGYVQRVGYAPGSATKEDTQLYGSGAVLLAASEIHQMISQ